MVLPVYHCITMTYTTTVTRKGQITIPKDFRDDLDIKTGQKISMILEGKGEFSKIALKPIPRLEDLMGIIKTNKKYSKEAARKAYIPEVVAGRI